MKIKNLKFFKIEGNLSVYCNVIFHQNKNIFVLKFDYNSIIVKSIKSKFNKPKFDWDNKLWLIDLKLNSKDEFAEFFVAIDAQKIPKNIVEILKYHWSKNEAYVDRSKQLFELSKADNCDFEVRGLAKDKSLFDYQKVSLKYFEQIKQSNGNVGIMIGDEMGLGKTIQAISIALHYNLFPVLVVCLSSLKYNWKKEFEAFSEEDLNIKVINSRTSISKEKLNTKSQKEKGVYIINYESLIKIKGLERIDFKLLVVDESHLVKNEKAKRSKALKRIADKTPNKVLLTGTSITNKVSEIINQLKILGVFNDVFGSWWSFVHTYCNAIKTPFGLDYTGASNLDKLHKLMRSSFYIRRERKQVFKDLPVIQRMDMEVELTNSSLYKSTENKLIELLNQQSKDSIYDTESFESFDEDSPEIHLTTLLKKIAGEGKIKACCEFIDNFLETTSEKLVIFGWHKDLIVHLAKKYNASYITGDVEDEKRFNAVESFQNKKEVRLIFLNIVAGGTGITLTAAHNCIFLEYPYSPAIVDQCESRLLRIGQKNNVVVRRLVGTISGCKTIDHHILQVIQKKRVVTNNVNKGLSAVINDDMKHEKGIASVVNEIYRSQKR